MFHLALLALAATFKLGFLYPQSSSGWAVESYSAFQLAIRHVNANASILGSHELGVAIASDTKGEPSAALRAATELLEDQTVVGLCGTAYSNAFEPPAMYASLKLKPMVSPGATSPGLVKKDAYPYAMRTVASVTGRIFGLVAIVHDLGWRHVAAIGTDDGYGDAVWSMLKDACKEASIGIEVYARHPQAPRGDASAADVTHFEKNLDGAINRIKGSRAKVVFLLSRGTDMWRVLPFLRDRHGIFDAGYAVFAIVGSVDWTSTAQGKDYAAPGLVYAVDAPVHETPLKTQLFTAWRDAATAYDNSAPTTTLYANPSNGIWDSGGPEPPTPHFWAQHMYDLVWAYALAIDRMLRGGLDPFDGDALRQAMRATDFEGVTGRIRLDAFQDRASDLTLFNVQGASISNLSAVAVGRLPEALGQHADGGWLHAGQQIHWPGNRRKLPVDGISERELTLATMLTWSPGSTEFSEKLFCAAQLATQHFNNRNGSVVPELGSSFGRQTAHGAVQNIVSLRLYPTLGRAEEGVSALEAALADGCVGILGPVRSSVSIPIAARSGGIPQISATASSDALSNKELYPGFGRTHPTDSQVASAAISVIRTNFWTWTNLGVLHVADAYGDSVLDGLQAAVQGTALHIAVAASYAPFASSPMLSTTMERLRASQVRVIICVAFPQDLRNLMEAADASGLLTAEFGWMLIDSKSGVQNLARTDITFARRMHGMLDFTFAPATTEGFSRFASVWSSLGPDDCSNDRFTAKASYFKQPPPSQAALMYDAAAILSLALEKVSDPGQWSSIIMAMRGVAINGTSGPVALKSSSDRTENGAKYALSNYVLNEMADASSFEVRTLAAHEVQPTAANLSDADAASASRKGKDDCPCLLAHAKPPPTHPDGGLLAMIEGVSYQYPSSYGLSGCAMHDFGTEPSCNAQVPPEWCSKSWCYVDKDSCQLNFEESLYFAHATESSSALAFSYSTCSSQQPLANVEWKGGIGAAPRDLLALGCPAGFEPGREGEAGCKPCKAGAFKSIRAFTQCRSCPPGQAQHELGQAHCNDCEQGTHQPDYGRPTCLACPPRETSVGGSTTCVCQSSYFRFAPDRVCEECPSFAKCTVGATLNTLEIPAGYYRLTDYTVDVHECHTNGRSGFQACVGGHRAHRALQVAPDGIEGQGNVSTSTIYCAPNHHGPLCRLCSLPNKYFSDTTGECTTCQGQQFLWLAVGGMCLAISMGIALAVWISLRAETSSSHSTARSSFWTRLRYLCFRAQALIAHVGLQVKAKQTIGLYQVLAAAPLAFEVTMPNEYVAFARSFDWISFKWLSDELALPTGCWVSSYAQSLTVSILWPMVIIALGAVCACAMNVRMRGLSREQLHHGTATSTTIAYYHALQEKGGYLALLLLFCVVLQVSAKTFDSFQCTEFGFDDRIGTRHRFLTLDLHIRCPDDSGESTEEFVVIQSIAAVGVLLWPVGIPLLFAALVRLAHFRRRQRTNFDHVLRKAVLFLAKDYKATCSLWESLELLRKLSLTGFILLIPQQYSFLRLQIALTVSFGFLMLHLQVRPFRKESDNALVAVVQAAIVCFLLCITGVKLCRNEADTSCQTLGISAFAYSIIILLVSALLLLLLAYQSMLAVTETSGTVHWVHNRTPVALSMPKHHSFHVFVSHTWKTGQDQAATIKRQLQLVLPGIQCFLDVDDLEDIALLEEYVAKSSLILLFASSGYFSSHACRREIRHTLRWRKPFLVIYEADRYKGGAPWQELIEELPKTLDVADLPLKCLLTDGRLDLAQFCPAAEEDSIATQEVKTALLAGVEVVRWHRGKEFQHQCLTCIATHLVGALNDTVASATASSRSNARAPQMLKKVSTSVLQSAKMVFRPYTSATSLTSLATNQLEVYIKASLLDGTPLVLTTAIRFFCSPNNPGSSEAAGQLIQVWERSLPTALTSSVCTPKVLSEVDWRSMGSKNRASYSDEGLWTARLRREASSWLGSQGQDTENDSDPTHLLLLLRNDTFSDDLSKGELAADIRMAMRHELPILLVHEVDSCSFDSFFTRTPGDLIRDGLYSKVAFEWLSGVHELVSAVMLLKKAHEDVLAATTRKPVHQRRTRVAPGCGSTTESPQTVATLAESSPTTELS